MKAIHYVLGLAFTKTGNQMVTVLKNRPAHQAGKINGVGGKIEPVDNTLFNPIVSAMVREFEEETGINSIKSEWNYFCELTIEKDALGGRCVIHCLSRFDNDIFDCETMESEKIEVHTVADICNKLNAMPNLPMLIGIALNRNIKFVKIEIEKVNYD